MRNKLQLLRILMIPALFLLSLVFNPSFSQVTVITGSYEGTGLDNEIISGLGFQPDVVIVKVEEGSNESQIRTSAMPDGYSRQMVGGAAMYLSRIKSFIPDGFIIGNNNDVNAPGKRYYYTAFKSSPSMEVGSYTGDGTNGRNITGLSFQPDLVILLPSEANRASFRSKTFTDADCSAFGSDFNLSKTITSLNSNGFTVGDEARANKSGSPFYYVAFKEFAGSMKAGSYLGNGIDNTVISGVGFRSEYMFIKSSASNNACQKSNVMPNSSSIEFSGSRIDDNRIRDVNDDGFIIGTQGQVNTNNKVYHYVCFRNFDPIPPSTCIATGTYTGDGSNDREITGVGFSPAVIMVKALDASNQAQIRTYTMPVGYCRQMVGAAVQYTNRIKDMTDNGFIIGTNNDVNAPGKTYMWTAFDASSLVEVSTYIGDGTDYKSVTGIPFEPAMVWVLPRTDNRASWRSSTFPSGNCSAFGSDFNIAKTITGFLPNGFIVGNSARANKIGEVYHFVAFRQQSDFLYLGTYLGNGTSTSSSNNISIPGSNLRYLMIKNAGASAAVQKSDQLAGAASIEFSGSRSDINRISYLGADGFTVGSANGQVNANNKTYHYAAFNGCTPAGRAALPVAELPGMQEEMSIFPNPAVSGKVTVRIPANQGGTSNLLLQDLHGRSVSTKTVNLAKGINRFTLDLSGLPSGIYLLRSTGAGKTQTIRLILGQ